MNCPICEMRCGIEEGGIGKCSMYTCTDGLICERYPDRYLAAVDTAIETMPMVHFHPRGKFLQVCTVGCNFKCNGCVSEILTDHLSAIEGALQEMRPEQVIERALHLSCIGVMFCFNEPSVSYFSFLRLARLAKAGGLLVGCSTNGYMTENALIDLIPFLDFVNLGIKGASIKTYRRCGVTTADPIRRNLSLLYQKGVYVEISAIFRKRAEAELLEVAQWVASLSQDIPIQVMRFIPFGEATIDLEPSVREAEAVCDQLREQLNYVYLFNTPGTEYLHSYCPHCGAKIMERGFFGPMGANLFHHRPDGRCVCGFKLPMVGEIHSTPLNESGYFGGYRTINALNMIRSILSVIGVTEKARVDAIMIQVLKEDVIKTLYERLNDIDAYFDTVDDFASLAGKPAKAHAFRRYVSERISRIAQGLDGLSRPSVYYALGHPLIAMFEDKMESRLTELAGAELTNRRIEREDRPGITIAPEQFCAMAPDIIIVSSPAAWPTADFIEFCTKNGLDAPAVRDKKVFHLHPFQASTKPDWILGLMHLANLIHPEVFHFDLKQEADNFYQTFFHLPFTDAQDRTFPGVFRGTAAAPETP